MLRLSYTMVVYWGVFTCSVTGQLACCDLYVKYLPGNGGVLILFFFFFLNSFVGKKLKPDMINIFWRDP